MAFVYAWIVPSRADHLHHIFRCSSIILCWYHVDTLNICMKEFGMEKNNFCFAQILLKSSLQFSLIGLFYMHWWRLHGPINSYHSFKWNNLILCLYNVDTLNICMKGFGPEKNNFWQNDSCENLDNFTLIRCLCMHRWCLHGTINSYHSFWWSNLILCLYNVDTLNICMKKFGFEKIFFDKMTAVRT